MAIEFYEERFKKDENSSVDIDSLMTEEQQKRVSYYVEKYEDLKSKMAERLEEDSGWEAIEKAYKGKREDKSIYSENNREINVMLPQIEGQVASMTNNNITGSYRGVGYSDQKFAATAGKVGDFILSQNPIKSIIKNFSRRYVKFGTSVLTVEYDEKAFSGMGLPKFSAPKLSQVFVDDKIDDIVLDLEDADFIIHEVGSKSLAWARDEYGDEIADAIELGNANDDFDYENDNEESFTYLRVWTKNNDKRNLQLIEISMNGILLKESEPNKPYYSHVFNRYPFFFAGMYKDEGDSYYFGDGYTMLPLQEYINKLLDVILRAIQFSSQGRTFIDPRSRVDPDDLLANDPAIPIVAENPNQTIRTDRGTGLNEVVFTLLQLMFQKVQEVTRFSSLMTGNGTGEQLTATQAGIQMQQGNTGIDDKKKDVSAVFGKALSYAIGMTMQFWDSAKAFRVADNEESFEWIDVRQFSNIPEMIPTDSQYRNDYKKMNPSADVPDFMQLEKDVEYEDVDEEGNTFTNTKKEGVTKELELDISVSIGEGLPSNKIAVYNMIVQLSQLPLYDPETGQGRPLIAYKQFGEMVQNFFGIKIEDLNIEKESTQQVVDERNNLQAELQALQGMENKAPKGGLNMNPNVPNANLAGTQVSPQRGGI